MEMVSVSKNAVDILETVPLKLLEWGMGQRLTKRPTFKVVFFTIFRLFLPVIFWLAFKTCNFITAKLQSHPFRCVI